MINARDGPILYRLPLHGDHIAELQPGWKDRDVRRTNRRPLMILVVISAGTVVYRYLEDWVWLDSFYFTVITLTTVGYGDLAPSSSGSKLFTVFYIATGISLLGAALNEVLKRRGRRMAAKRVRRTS